MLKNLNVFCHGLAFVKGALARDVLPAKFDPEKKALP